MKKPQSLFKRVMISAERGKYKACQICQKKFGTEHQCKRCKRAVCEKCSNFKGRIFTDSGQEDKTLHRQCKICKEESDSIKRFVETNHILFLQDTKALEWLNQFGVTKEQAKAEYLQAQNKISQSEQSEIKKLKNNLNNAFSEIPGVFNYSLREFIYYVIKENEFETLKQATGRILETFLSNYNEVGYSPDLIMLTIFFLCFGTESSAFSLLNIFFAEMVQANLYPSNIMQYDNGEDIERVLLVLTSSFKMQQQDKPLITNFLKSRLIKYQQCFTINMLQIESTYYIIDSLYSLHKQAQDEFIKFIASALSQNISDVKVNQQYIEEFEVILLRQVKSSIIKDEYFKTKSLQFTPYTTRMMSRSQITRRFSSVIQDSNQSNIDFDKLNNLNKVVESQKEEIAKLNFQLTSTTELVRKKTVQLKQKDQTNIQNDLKQVEDEDQIFSNLRRKTLNILNQEEVDEDVAVLTDYINKLEEVLILKHRVVKDQNIKILEVQENNQILFEEILKLKKEVQQSEIKFIDQTNITHQIEKEINEKQRIIDEYKQKNKELQDNLESVQTENNQYKIQLLEFKALSGVKTVDDGVKQNQYQRELQRLQEENNNLQKKITELDSLIQDKSILGTEQENLKKQLNMKEEQINSLNEQIRNLNEKVSNLEQQRTLQLKQMKHLEDQISSKEREYMTEMQKITYDRDLSKQRINEGEAQILKLQQNDQKLKNEISNLNEELQQQLLKLEQLNKQIKDYEIQQNQSRETSLDINKGQQIRLEKLEQQNQNMNLKIEAQNQEIKSYIAKIEEQLTTITELKQKVQEEESLRKAKEKQVNDKVQQIGQLENQLIKIQEKYNLSNRQQQEMQNQYEDLKKRYDVESNNIQSLQSKSIEYNSLQQKYIDQSQKLSSLEKQLLDYNEIADQNQKSKKELQSLTDLLDSKLTTIVAHETKIIDLTNQLKESNSQLQQVRKENHEIMQKKAQDMQVMDQLKQIDVENGELKQKVYSQEATIQNQETLLSVLKGNQLNLEQSQMKLKIDYQHLEEKYSEKLLDLDEKSRTLFNLQNKFDSLNYRVQQLEENLRQLEELRDDYQSKYDLALQELDIYKGKDKEINQMAANKIELQEQMDSIQKKNKILERELQVTQNALQSKESDILQLQHTIQKKEQQITTLEGVIVKLKSDLTNSKNSYEQLQLELTEMNSEQKSSGELFSQVKNLTSDNLNKNTHIDQLKLQINELQDKNRNLENQYNKLRGDALIGNSLNSESFELRQKLEELEGQFQQSQFTIKQKDQEIQELKYQIEKQNQQQQSQKEIQNNNQLKNQSNDNENIKIQEYQFIIQQQTEEIENMKRNSQGLGEELTELLTQIVSVFLKKKIKKDQLNIASVLDQIKLFQKENISLTIREEDDEQLVLQKLQQYRGDYINFRFRVEQIITKITVLKQQMLQVISEATIQGKKKDVDKNMDVENLVMYFKLLLDSQAVQYSNQLQLFQQCEAELKSYQNNTSPQGQIIQQVKELLSKTPFLTQSQIYQFTEPKVSIKLRKDQDQEDARLIVEAKNQQIQWLKNLINEKQDQLAVMNTYLANLKQLMDKYHLK
ncbi:unnamed protein product [Paramecium sonneborni]|uniref:FYVE-type domain-containing protein n=1 Tax=Paramecium sonneborni TaxID=65129 RepID=A0A8S1KD99_9CILI|nr:unnamed protein product [Paramecium sonneborni]